MHIQTSRHLSSMEAVSLLQVLQRLHYIELCCEMLLNVSRERSARLRGRHCADPYELLS